MLKLLLWPFILLWRLVALILNLTGRLIGIVLGLTLLMIGVLLSLTGIGAIVGVPIGALGFLMLMKSVV